MMKKSPILATSEEKTNGTRLARLLIDGGTHVLREFFHSTCIYPSANLQVLLNNNSGRLQALSKRVLSNSQWEKLFPSSGDPPDSKTFDITLLHLLLREIGNLTEPLTGWHDMPADSDTSPEANIVRIKYMRNKLSHIDATSIPNEEFEDKWNKISTSLVALGLDQAEIDRLKIEPIDHDTERRVEEEVKKWKLEIEPRVENLEKAFQRMESEFSSIKRSISEEINRELTNCLPDEVSDVFGRHQEIQEVTEAIQMGQVAAVVITGGPGFGKSTVAKKVAHGLVANLEFKRTVLYCSLRSKSTSIDVAASLILVCSKTHSQPPENPQHWLLNWSKQQQQPVTFVLDNADDVLESDQSHFVSILRDMRNLSGHKVNFVITSRKAFKDPDSMKLKEVKLHSLLPEDAKRVLLSQISKNDNRRKLTKTETLVELCGCLPLALCIVGSLLSDYTENELIESLEKEPLEVLREDESDTNSVEKAIKMSFDFLNKSEQEALVVMTVFVGSFNSNAVKAVMAARVDSSIQPVLILRSLKNRSLVQQLASQRYEIHTLIQSYAEKIGRENYPQILDRGVELARIHFMSRLADNANKYWSKDKCKESLQSFNEDRPNMEYFLHDYVRGLKEQGPNLMKTMPEILGKKLSEKCLYLEMCLLPSVYVQLLEDLLLLFTSGEHVSKQVELLCLLGHESRKVGNRDKYKECLKEAMNKHSRNTSEFDKEKVSRALFLNHYARFLSEEKRPSEAKQQFRSALEICDEHLPTDYVQKAVTLLFSGREDNRRGNQRNEAERKLNEALNLFQNSLGNHVMTALLLKDLADFHLFHGAENLGSDEDRKRSITLYQEALEMMETIGIRDRKVCILILANLGRCYQLQGNFEEAMQLYEESLNIAERELDDDHRWKIYVKIQMANWWKEEGTMEKARALKEEAMQMSHKLALPDNQPPNKFLLQGI